VKNFLALVLCLCLFSYGFTEFAEGNDVEIPSEGILYREASRKLTQPPEEINQLVRSVIDTGWREEEQLTKWLDNNHEAIELFREATMQPGDAFMFGKRPPQTRCHDRDTSL